MKYKAVSAIAFSSLIALSGAALADSPPVTADMNQPDEGMNMHMDDGMKRHFEYLDHDNDGKVTKAEMDAHDKMSEHFHKMIKDRGGKI